MSAREADAIEAVAGWLVELDTEAAEHPSVVAAVSAASRLRKDVPEVVEQGVLMPKSDVARPSRWGLANLSAKRA